MFGIHEQLPLRQALRLREDLYVSGHHEATPALTMKNIRVITDIHGIKQS